MPSPPVEEEPSTSQSIQGGTVPPQASARSILSFWGNGGGPSQPPPQPAAPKRKRKKADEGPVQGRISLGDGNGAAWGIKKVEDESRVAAAKGKGKAKAGGELDELKEMSKKGKQAAGGAKDYGQSQNGKRKSLGTADELKPTQGKGDSSFIGDSSPPSNLGGTQQPLNPSIAARVSPQKRKRGRPRKSDKTISSVAPTSPVIVPVLSSDPIVPLSPSDITFTGSSSSLKVSKAAMSRTSSIGSKGAVDDPIDIEHEPQRGPKKIAFAADKIKAAHPMFARIVAETPSEQKLEGSTSMVASPEVRTKPTTIELKSATSKVHSFFGQKSSGTPGQMKNGWGGGVKEGEEPDALWPGGIFPNHEAIAGPSRLHTPLKRRMKGSRPPSCNVGDNSGWFPSRTQTVSTSTRYSLPSEDGGSQSVPRYISSHPALLSTSSRSDTSNRQIWAERYRPTQAAQVLGNELEATYLRDWLRTLSVGGKDGASRKVVRKVKRYKPQLVEGWIVDDAGLFGDPVDRGEEEEVEYVDYIEPYLPLGQRPNEYPSLETSQLTNAILLTGPHGAGKSATIHAAATELGWEVFEVYPGMGKRTAANLMSWVGDVGKNHLVVKGGKAEPAKPELKQQNALKSFFGGPTRKVVQDDEDPIAFTGSQGSLGDPIEIDTSPRKEDQLVLDPEAPSKGVRQSLILIDEADILFAEENTFWPAVIALIAESRRPIIITCNDTNRIPLDSLPLQAILHLQPPPSYLAIPYLEAVAKQQGLVAAGYGAHLYQQCTSRVPRTLTQPLPPNGNEPLPSFDLRRALCQMQLDRGVTGTTAAEAQPPKDLRAAFVAIDNHSWVDAFVAPRNAALMETCEIDRLNSTADDELGIHALFKPDVRDVYTTTLPAYDYSLKMAEEIGSLAGPPEAVYDLQTAQTLYVRSLLPLLDPLIPLSAPLLPAPPLFTLYMPVLQDMVERDDVLEILEEDALSRGEGLINRKTGRPKRATVGGGLGYGRYLDQDTTALQAARESRLVWTS